jgi:hypothetical protein
MVKIEVTNAVIDGHNHGEQLEVSKADADKFIAIGYAKLVEEVKPKAEPKAKAKK